MCDINLVIVFIATATLLLAIMISGLFFVTEKKLRPTLINKNGIDEYKNVKTTINERSTNKIFANFAHVT